MSFIIGRFPAFKHAFNGLLYIIRTQRNAWVHSIATVIVVAMGIWLKLSIYAWGFITIAIGSVWICEALNTAIEAAIDLISPNAHPLAKIAKDCAAAAVLIASICSAIIGFLIMTPPLIERLRGIALF